jgi:putative SOS response-associated peptidase YedK
MCGRFTQSYTWAELTALYRLTAPPLNLQPRYNIAPTETVDVIVPAGVGFDLVRMRWGLIPWWWKKGVKDLPATFNARAETVADKPMFRDALRRGRCVIPATGYYEWEPTPSGKQPFYITAADSSVLSFAGLWDRWKDNATGEPRLSCTIIVTDANALTRPIHDRMPVLLDRDHVGPWLAGEAGLEVLKPPPNSALRMFPVSRRVNRTGDDDDPGLIEPVALHA